MIQKCIQRSIHLFSLARHSSGVLLFDDKFGHDYEVLISDVTKDDLSGLISKRIGKDNLAPLSSDEQEFSRIRNGIVYGLNNRGIISLPTRFKNKRPIWIHYLVGTGSPWTFLSMESIRSLIGSEKV